MDGKSGNAIQSIETTFEIVELLRKKSGAGVTEISDELDIPVSTTHNHLSTLQQKGYLLQKEGDYHVGLKFVYLGDHVKNQLDIYAVGEQYINQLADETGEVANLLVENGGFGVYLKVVRSEDALDLDSYSRRREYLHCTAAGKAILAHESREKVDRVIEEHGLPEFTENTITNSGEFYAELEEIRNMGYAFDDEERLDGLRCVGSPLLNESNGVFGAISVSGPTIRMSGERFRNTIPDQVYNTAKVIEIEINHS